MASDGLLTCIDPYPAGRLGFNAQRVIARSEVSKIRNGHIEWVRATDAEAGAEYAKSGRAPVDFVFIDADHTYDGLRSDWEAWSHLIAAGGIVALHDSCLSTSRAIDDAGSVIYTRDVIRRDPRFRVVEVVDTLTVLERVPRCGVMVAGSYLPGSPMRKAHAPRHLSHNHKPRSALSPELFV